MTRSKWKLIYVKRLDKVSTKRLKLTELAKRKRKHKGKFICIEGIDGCGKTTQAKKLVRNLRDKDYDATYTTEPSAGKIGALIQGFVLGRKSRVPIALEALLFAADRVDHVETEVEPLLRHGKVVVCDRYLFSSLAYQGAAGLDLHWMDCVNKFALKPDVTLFLDVSPDVAISRLKRKKSVMETLRNLTKVRDAYLSLVQQHRMIVVDGSKSIDEVAKNILNVVLRELKS